MLFINFKVYEISESSLQNIVLSSETTTHTIPVYLITDNYDPTIGSYGFDESSLNISLDTDSSAKKIILLKYQKK